MSLIGVVAVIDFETTGLSPAIVLLEGGQIVDRLQRLMNAGVRIPFFITQLTGISNAVIASAPVVAHHTFASFLQTDGRRLEVTAKLRSKGKLLIKNLRRQGSVVGVAV